ncbi:thiol:disulfide interchange protein DsbA/DsbL [Burkholderiales bacterium]|nr:thiol:disulfide interchange protein DsbA/DsbL [Burkholderiales bacterium]
MKNLLIIFMVFLSHLSLQVSAQAITEGKEYQVIQAQGDKGDVVQVYEFFSYACGHCYEFQPLIESWAESPPEGVQFNYMPAVFNERMIPLAKLFFTLEEMQLLKSVHYQVYEAIHEKRINLLTEKRILSWAEDNKLIKFNEFEKLYKSFSVDSKVKKAVQLVRSYRLPGTPYVTVKGKYITGPSMVLRSEGGGVDVVRFIATLNTLIEKD